MEKDVRGIVVDVQNDLESLADVCGGFAAPTIEFNNMKFMYMLSHDLARLAAELEPVCDATDPIVSATE